MNIEINYTMITCTSTRKHRDKEALNSPPPQELMFFLSTNQQARAEIWCTEQKLWGNNLKKLPPLLNGTVIHSNRSTFYWQILFCKFGRNCSISCWKRSFSKSSIYTYFHYLAIISLENMMANHLYKTQWGLSCTKFGCYWPSGSEEDENINI